MTVPFTRQEIIYFYYYKVYNAVTQVAKKRMDIIVIKLRYFVALWLGKFVRIVMRLFGRNATFLPGRIALSICPSFLSLIEKPAKVIAVTGTNGKTTVTNLIVSALKAAGISVLNNSYGSNTATGISCALFASSTLTGKAKHEIAVFEVDERSAMRTFPFIKADLVVITNLFRDTIMRNAHPAYIAGIISANIPPESKMLLNADDLISGRVAPDNPRVYYGLERMDTDVVECINLINDIQLCPKCNNELIYEYRKYHHIGKAYCSGCDFKSPDCDYCGSVDLVNTDYLTVKEKGTLQSVRLPGDSVFTMYNTLSAYSALREIGLDSETAAAAIGKAAIPESRYNETEAGGVRIVMQMGKERNALANSRTFDYVAKRPEEKELILMMNRLGDAKTGSENITWLYDCDFEFLKSSSITRIVAAGARALDYCARLHFAGVSPEIIYYTKDELDAPSQLALKPGTSVYILYGGDSTNLAYRVRDIVCKKAGEQSKS